MLPPNGWIVSSVEHGPAPPRPKRWIGRISVERIEDFLGIFRPLEKNLVAGQEPRNLSTGVAFTECSLPLYAEAAVLDSWYSALILAAVACRPLHPKG